MITYKGFEIMTIPGKRTKWMGITPMSSAAVVAESKTAVYEMIDKYWEVVDREKKHRHS